tara:strand:+ start:3396 stop:4073 length:678 start_codon:yes stop_codon:yes gene_type:complete
MADLTKLQNSLLKAKKVMGAVESGNPIQSSQNRTMNETMTQQVPPEQLLSQLPSNQSNSLMAQAQQERPMNMNPKASLTKDRIMESKLPDAIKKAMISNPIPTMDFNNATNKLSPEFIEEVSKKMKSQDYSVDGMRSTSNSTIDSSTIDIPPPSKPSITNTTRHKAQSSDMKSIIKETIKESLDEIVENKVRNILEETSINENLSLRVGNKIFFGKINKVKSVKK